MIKHLLTGVLLGAAPLALSAADNLNVMPWVNGTEWAGTSVEKKSDGSYVIHVSEDWAGPASTSPPTIPTSPSQASPLST